MNGEQFGPLTGLVGTVGSIFAAGVAIALTWRGRARWEPSETDIAKGPERVGGLVTAVLIVILFVVTRPPGSGGLLPALAIFLLVEGLLIAFVIRYRRRKRPRDLDGAQIHGATRLELAKSRKVERIATTCEVRRDRLRVGAELADIKHVLLPVPCLRSQAPGRPTGCARASPGT